MLGYDIALRFRGSSAIVQSLCGDDVNLHACDKETSEALNRDNGLFTFRHCQITALFSCQCCHDGSRPAVETGGQPQVIALRYRHPKVRTFLIAVQSTASAGARLSFYSLKTLDEADDLCPWSSTCSGS